MKHGPISPDAFEAVREWLRASIEHTEGKKSAPPPSTLLFTDMPQGSLAGLTNDFGVQVRARPSEGYPDNLRSPRYFDPEGIAVIRLLLAGGGSIKLNKRDTGTTKRLDYLVFKASPSVTDSEWIASYEVPKSQIPLLRIIADTPPGYQTVAAADHYSYRRSDIPFFSLDVEDVRLAGYSARTPRSSRRDAVALAKALVETNRSTIKFRVTDAELDSLFQQAFRLLDLRPLKR